MTTLPHKRSMASTITIRPYTADDWDRVCTIHDAARRDELAAAGLEAAYLTLAQTADNEGFYDCTLRVAVVDGQVEGFVAFTDDELAWLYVHPMAYRRGIGTALIRFALAEAGKDMSPPGRPKGECRSAQHEGTPMSAEVLDGNAAALAAYCKAGFTVVGREHGRMPGNEGFPVSVTVLRHPGLNARG